MSLWKLRCRLNLPFLLFRRCAEGKEENGAAGSVALAGCAISCGCGQEVRSWLHPSRARILAVHSVPRGGCAHRGSASFSPLLLSYRHLRLRGLLPDVNQRVLKGSSAARLTKKGKRKKKSCPTGSFWCFCLVIFSAAELIRFFLIHLYIIEVIWITAQPPYYLCIWKAIYY